MTAPTSATQPPRYYLFLPGGLLEVTEAEFRAVRELCASYNKRWEQGPILAIARNEIGGRRRNISVHLGMV